MNQEIINEFISNQKERKSLYYKMSIRIIDKFDFSFGISDGEEKKDELAEFISKLMVIVENQNLGYYSMKQIEFEILPFLKEKCIHHEETNSGTIGEVFDSHITDEELKQIKAHLKIYVSKIIPTENKILGNNNK